MLLRLLTPLNICICVHSLTFNHKEFMLLNKLSGRGTKTVPMETERIVMLLTKAHKWTCPSRI